VHRPSQPVEVRLEIDGPVVADQERVEDPESRVGGIGRIVGVAHVHAAYGGGRMLGVLPSYWRAWVSGATACGGGG
jgi:hypothetical protein